MKNLVLTFLLVFTTVAATFGQEEKPKFYYMVGGGFSFSGSGDVFSHTLENELNYRINKRFTVAASLSLGRNLEDKYRSLSYTQGNLNLVATPTSYDVRNCLKMGMGVSVINFAYSYPYLYSSSSNNPDGYFSWYEGSTRLGVNIIIEDDYDITQKYIVGVKGFAQIYGTHRIFTGLTLKLGLRL